MNDALFPRRIHFAFAVTFHYLFLQLTMGIAPFLGSWLSGLFIITTDAWMQPPVVRWVARRSHGPWGPTAWERERSTVDRRKPPGRREAGDRRSFQSPAPRPSVCALSVDSRERVVSVRNIDELSHGIRVARIDAGDTALRN